MLTGFRGVSRATWAAAENRSPWSPGGDLKAK